LSGSAASLLMTNEDTGRQKRKVMTNTSADLRIGKIRLSRADPGFLNGVGTGQVPGAKAYGAWGGVSRPQRGGDWSGAIPLPRKFNFF